jgi:hypothetical protein
MDIYASSMKVVKTMDILRIAPFASQCPAHWSEPG